MSELDVKTKNILVALESFIRRSSKEFDEKTHEDMLNTLIKHTTKVLDDYKGFKAGKLSSFSYGKSLLKLAEVTLMAVRRLPG